MSDRILPRHAPPVKGKRSLSPARQDCDCSRTCGAVVTHVRNSRYARAKQSLRICGAVVTRVRSSRYAYAEQSLRVRVTVVTCVRSSRYARASKSRLFRAVTSGPTCRASEATIYFYSFDPNGRHLWTTIYTKPLVFSCIFSS